MSALAGGGGLDTFQISTADAAYLAGSSIDGGTNAGDRDRITSAGLAGTTDLRAIVITNVEELHLPANDAVTRVNASATGTTSSSRRAPRKTPPGALPQ